MGSTPDVDMGERNLALSYYGNLLRATASTGYVNNSTQVTTSPNKKKQMTKPKEKETYQVVCYVPGRRVFARSIKEFAHAEALARLARSRGYEPEIVVERNR